MIKKGILSHLYNSSKSSLNNKNLKTNTNLRRQQSGRQPQWSEDQLKSGFDYFFKRYNKYPTSKEIDKFPYLPTAMSLSRTYGSLVKAREVLGLETLHHNKGKLASINRSNQWRHSKDAENDMYNFLINQVDEMRIHEEKPILKKPNIVRADFFVFTNNRGEGFAIDCFTTESLRSLGTHIHIKTKKYKNVSIPIYYVLYTNSIKDTNIQKMLNNKKIMLPKNIYVFTEVYFKENFKSILNKNGFDD